MNENKSNNLYSLESERKRLEQIRKQRQKQKPRPKVNGWKAKVMLFGQVCIFLIMVSLLMYQCRGH